MTDLLEKEENSNEMDSVKDDDENDRNFLPSPLSESSDGSSDGTNDEEAKPKDVASKKKKNTVDPESRNELPESSSSCPPKMKSTTRNKIKPNQEEVFSFADDKENEPEIVIPRTQKTNKGERIYDK
ncbi:serine-rich 25 kDa antigen protein-like [Clytia hemisphaerica]|uniref:serine-rich 25 kDa antigen protein-like n=1 Tax=Clytia hemisphaerica TaxID=252671 RepID=UPI0034D75DF3